MISIKRITEIRVDTLSLRALSFSVPRSNSRFANVRVGPKTTCQKRTHLSILSLDIVDLTNEHTSGIFVKGYLLYMYFLLQLGRWVGQPTSVTIYRLESS